jgi:hypothetical protein
VVPFVLSAAALFFALGGSALATGSSATAGRPADLHFRLLAF